MASLGKHSELCIFDLRGALPIGQELTTADIEEARLPIAVPALGHQIAVTCVGAGLEQIDTRSHDRSVSVGEGDLLADDGEHVAVERVQESLDVPADLIP